MPPPALIPVEFKVHQTKRTYYKKKQQKTWAECTEPYACWGFVLVACLALSGILYLKYIDKQHQKKSQRIPQSHTPSFPNGQRIPLFLNDRDNQGS
jgi:hypothetical protein